MKIHPLLLLLPTLSSALPAAPVGDVYVDLTNANCAAADGSLAAPFCTVAEAVAAAAIGDTIHIAPGVYHEHLALTRPVTLRGTAGSAVTILDGSLAGRVIAVQTTALIEGLTIRNGLSSYGGGISNLGDLTLRSSRVTQNQAIPASTSGGLGMAVGGGIANNAVLSIEDCSIDSNLVAPALWPAGYTVAGGAIYSGQFAGPSTTSLTLVDVEVTGNQLLGAGGAPGVSVDGFAAGVIIAGSPFTNSHSLVATRCTVSGNVVAPDINVLCSAGLHIQSADLQLVDSTISGNSGPLGWAGLSVRPFDGLPIVTEVRNCTLAGNEGTGVFYFGDGASPLRLTHCTVTDNDSAFVSAGFAAGVTVWNFGSHASTRVELHNTIVAGNSGSAGGGEDDLAGQFLSHGYNLIGKQGAAASGFTHGMLGDLVGTPSAPLDAQLGILAANGGNTSTCALAPASLAIDAADPMSSEPFDQRGTPRPSGAADIGAFELGAPPSLGVPVCDGAPNSAGAGATLAMLGSASIAQNDLRLAVDDLPQNSLGYFLTSRSAFTLVNPGGAQGNLCIASLEMGRYANQVLDSGATGRVEMAVDLTAIPLAGVLVLGQGNEVWYWQYWYRDQNPTSTSNFSAARGLTLQ